MIPTDRNSFKQYCLRKLGHPVIEINVSEEQIDDRVDEALKLYADYHFDGSDRVYYKHQITQEDIDNQYITLPENIIGVVRVFPVNHTSTFGSDLFSLEYQLVLNQIYAIGTVSLVPYYQTREGIELMNQILTGQQPIRYTRHQNKLYIDMNWKRRGNLGRWIIIEAFNVIDPDVYTDVWSDLWLQNYATALIKQNWGSNLTKFVGMQMPGGVTFNGERILDDANREIEALKQELQTSWSLPIGDLVG